MVRLILISFPSLIISVIISSSEAIENWNDQFVVSSYHESATAQSQPFFVLPLLYKQPHALPQPVYEGQSIQWECGVNITLLRAMVLPGVKSVKWWKYNDDGQIEEIKDTENKQARIFISTVDNDLEYAKILILSGIRQSDARDYGCEIWIDDEHEPRIYLNWLKLERKCKN